MCDGFCVSPTLLEFVVAALLLCVAWRIGLEVAPRVLEFFKRPLNGIKAEKHRGPRQLADKNHHGI